MIKVEFVNFEDMVNFAKQLLGQVSGDKREQSSQVAATVPEGPVSISTPSAPVTPAAPAAVPVVPVTSSAPVTSPVAQQTPAMAVPTASATYTADDLARAAMSLMDSGRQTELLGLLQQFGVVSLPELKPEQYGAFATALRGMGAQI